MTFSNSLIHWYLQNKRDLPWRNTNDPYIIWLSEIILQQTRVAQGLPYFNAFLSAFPTVFDLANANEEQVLKLWQGLGYYSRARNLHATAKYVVDECNGIFPDDFDTLIKLKGIGDYTAAAIASFAKNEKVAVLDGNVYRVLSRFFEVENDLSENSTKKIFQKLAQELLPNDNTNTYNQAIMEFGALQCVPKNPTCSSCIFNSNCAALQKNKVHLLPIKSKKTKNTNRFFTYIIIEDSSNQFIVQQRTEKGIWQHLYEFPLLESHDILDEAAIKAQILTQFSNVTVMAILKSETVVHKLSHQTLHIQFVKLKCLEKLNHGISVEALKKLPFPIVLYNFIERFFYK